MIKVKVHVREKEECTTTQNPRGLWLEIEFVNFDHRIKRQYGDVLALNAQLGRQLAAPLEQQPTLSGRSFFGKSMQVLALEIQSRVEAFLNEILNSEPCSNRIELIRFVDEQYAASIETSLPAIDFILQPLEVQTKTIGRRGRLEVSLNVSQPNMSAVWKFELVVGKWMFFQVSFETEDGLETVHYPTVYGKGDPVRGRYVASATGTLRFLWKNQSKLHTRKIRYAVECVPEPIMEAALLASDDAAERTRERSTESWMEHVFAIPREVQEDDGEEEDDRDSIHVEVVDECASLSNHMEAPPDHVGKEEEISLSLQVKYAMQLSSLTEQVVC